MYDLLDLLYSGRAAAELLSLALPDLAFSRVTGSWVVLLVAWDEEAERESEREG